MKKLLLSPLLFCFCHCLAQTEASGGGGFSNAYSADEITPSQRQSIIATLKYNEQKLVAEGKLKTMQPNIVAFEWPLKQAAGNNDNGFYGISNYVDENSAYPNAVLDYNCGDRSYDLSSGYNHAGTDIFTWPFPWNKMQNNAVEVIAAAPGIIIGKDDGNYDQNCAFCTSSCNWNAVYVLHTDGSVAWYGHMKSGSLTSKIVGDTLAVGEYLGVVGSSGNSTGPHMHFEVYTNTSYTTLIDPWAGSCNYHNGNTSWWANQQPYRVPGVCKVMTHGSPPGIGSCPSAESMNEQVNFVNGNSVVFGSYYRDQINGQSAYNVIYRPDGSVYTSWNLNFTNTYNASWWYKTYTLPNPAPTGIWTFTSTYNGQTSTTHFAVNTLLPLTLKSFNAVKVACKVKLEFVTNDEEEMLHYRILRSANGNDFSLLQKITPKYQHDNAYTTIDQAPLQTNYYKLEIVNKNGTKTYSKSVFIVFEKKGNYMAVLGNPAQGLLQLNVLHETKNVALRIIDISGRIADVRQYATLSQGKISLSISNLSPGAYRLQLLQSNGQTLDYTTFLKL